MRVITITIDSDDATCDKAGDVVIADAIRTCEAFGARVTIDDGDGDDEDWTTTSRRAAAD